MAWVWYDRFDTKFKPAEVDPKTPVRPEDLFVLRRPTPPIGTPVFRVRTTLAAFERFHCPSVLASSPIVDLEWQRIILGYVPKDLVQFCPVKVICKDSASEKYSMLLVFAQVRCIDPERSDVTSSRQFDDVLRIYGCDYYVHHENCLGKNHLAHDEQQRSHLVLSDALKDALAATGESSMFYQPGDLPLFGQRKLH